MSRILYPGTTPQNGWYYTSGGRVWNDSTTDELDLSCPLQNADGSAGSSTHNTDVYIIDNSSAADVECQQWSLAGAGTSWTWGTAVDSTGRNSSTPTTITLSDTLSSAAMKGVYCKLPTKNSGNRSAIQGFAMSW